VNILCQNSGENLVCKVTERVIEHHRLRDGPETPAREAGPRVSGGEVPRRCRRGFGGWYPTELPALGTRSQSRIRSDYSQLASCSRPVTVQLTVSTPRPPRRQSAGGSLVRGRWSSRARGVIVRLQRVQFQRLIDTVRHEGASRGRCVGPDSVYRRVVDKRQFYLLAVAGPVRVELVLYAWGDTPVDGDCVSWCRYVFRVVVRLVIPAGVEGSVSRGSLRGLQ